MLFLQFAKVIVILLVTTATAIAERFRAFRNLKEGIVTQRRITNVILWLINSVINPLIVITSTYFADGFFDWRPDWLLAFNYSGILLILLIILDVLIIDCFVYFWHRANHVIPFLWRFHQVHHADETLDLTSGVRFHFIEVMMSGFLRLFVIILFDIPLSSVVIAETALLVISIFQHGNFRLPEKWEKTISLLFVTPGIHWIHHHRIREDTDSNYANIFSFWDLVFGTRSPRRRFSGMIIGIEGIKTKQDFMSQLLLPFKRKKKRKKTN